MTSDAKIGLLLGLVFIFIIAFVINGLPNFRDRTNNNELTTNMVSLPSDSIGLPAEELQAEQVRDWTGLAEQQVAGLDEIPTGFRAGFAGDQYIRSITPLPQSFSAGEGPDESTEHGPKTGPGVPLPITVEETEAKKPTLAKAAAPKVYVVKDGDSLAGIAKKFYGAEEGNKKANITRIFQANQRLLESPDEIYIGQRLIIPPLSSLPPAKGSIASILSDKIFRKVESIGRKHLSGDEAKAKQGEWYVVKEGDNLWKIAAEQLGSGGRFKEISKLNAGILDDEDVVGVGVRLRLPTR